MAIQYGDPPTDRNFLALAVCYGFDFKTREFVPIGKRWAEAYWHEKDRRYKFWTGQGRTATTERLELTAWAELPVGG